MEYKAWLNLEDREAHARLAKHLCALANHGGGFLVGDDMTPAGPQPPEAGPYDQDKLSGFVGRYLTFNQVVVGSIPTRPTKQQDENKRFFLSLFILPIVRLGTGKHLGSTRNQISTIVGE